jgi:hypothetical protein
VKSLLGSVPGVQDVRIAAAGGPVRLG